MNILIFILLVFNLRHRKTLDWKLDIENQIQSIEDQINLKHQKKIRNIKSQT